MNFNWRCGFITRHTIIDTKDWNTQKVRHFLVHKCGSEFQLDRDFMAWIRDGADKTMGDVADEWLRRHNQAGDA